MHLQLGARCALQPTALVPTSALLLGNVCTEGLCCPGQPVYAAHDPVVAAGDLVSLVVAVDRRLCGLRMTAMLSEQLLRLLNVEGCSSSRV